MSVDGEVGSSEVAPRSVVDVVEPLLTELPATKKKEALRVISQSIQYQGPLPPPEMMARYGELIEDGPNRLMRLLEKQTDHRIQMESQLVGTRVSTTKHGQYFAAGLSAFFGIIALVLGISGHDWLAGTICVTTIIGLATVFVLGKEPGTKSSPDKQNEVAGNRKPSQRRKK